MTTWKDPRLGFKVLRGSTFARPDLAELVKLTTANVSDILGRLLTLDYRVRPVVLPKERVAGFAITVLVRPGDNTIIFKAMEMAQPDDVIVIGGHHDTDNSVLGGVMAEMAAAQGLAAFVTDALVRDLQELENVGLPIFARGVTPVAPTWGSRMGQINTSICCGGVIINPGDIVMGDKDGVVVVPRDDLDTVLSRGKEVKKREWDWLHPETAGKYTLYEKCNSELAQLGCEIEQ